MSTAVEVLEDDQHALYVERVNMGGRIALRLAELGQGPQWLAAETGNSVQAISALIQRDSERSRFAPEIANALGVHLLWLVNGEGPKFSHAKLIVRRPEMLYSLDEDEGPPNTAEPTVELQKLDVASRIPLISWVAAGAWNEAFDPYAPGAASEWIAVPGEHSADAVALRVRGDSMEPRFPDGCVIIVEPHRQPKSGQFVVVRNNDWNEATFKQYVVDGGVKLLKPLNSRYPVQQIGPGTVLVGVIVRKFIDEAV